MADHPQVYQVIQLAPEVTAGSAVGATRKLRSMTLVPSAQGNIDAMKASGYKYDTITALNQEWTQFKMDGVLSPNEIIYPLSGVISAGSVATAGTSANGTAYTWTYSTHSDSADTFKTFTVEAGDSNRAQQYPGVVFTDFTLTLDRTQAKVSGQAIGQRMTDDISLSGTATQIAQSLIVPGKWDLYMDDSQAALATATALSRGFQAIISVSGRQAPIWPINSSNESYATTVEAQGVNVQLQLTLQADVTGMALLDTMRNNARKFFRVEGIGGSSVGGTAHPYKVTWDFSGQVIQMPSEQTMQELKMMQWTFGAVHDETWGYAHQVTVVNDMAAY